MDNSGIYVGLDIGTTSIKIIVAEYLKGQMNVIGVGSEKSEGLDRGVIVDINKVVESIKKAVAQAEQKANVAISEVSISVPANRVKMEQLSGMIAVATDSKEISDEDVVAVTQSALTGGLPPEREVIAVIPKEFTVDGFEGIKDPRGMIGTRLEFTGTVLTGPKTMLHNLRKCVARAGLTITQTVCAPLALASVALTSGERDFGTILVDLGGGQTTVSVVHDNQLKFCFVDQEGGEFVTKDISMVLNTTLQNAEKIKRDYGTADTQVASKEEDFPVEVVGKNQPIQVDEYYLAEIIEARLSQIFEKVGNQLATIQAYDLPGGVVLTGGVAAMAGVEDLATDYFDAKVRTYIPDQMGLRHPSFTMVIGLVDYVATRDEIYNLAQIAIHHEAMTIVATENGSKKVPTKKVKTETKKNKKSKAEDFKALFGKFFD